MMFHEGQAVSYIGDGAEGVSLGTHGRILLLASNGGHVQWSSGPMAGRVQHLPDLERAVAPASKAATAVQEPSADGLDDSLEVGLPTTEAARLMNTSGPLSVVASLANSGALGDDLAEEALGFVESRLRGNETVQRHLVDLDDEDRSEVYRLAAQSVLGEAANYG